ncbi:MAG: branched-chain amino acid ABC transporter permease [Limisphaerales bacterium]
MSAPLPEPIAYRRLYRGPAVLLLLVLLTPLAARGSYAYLLPLGQLCGIYAILATGLTLLMGFCGQVSLGHAGFYGFGAYTAAIAATTFHTPVWLAVPLALLATGLLAMGGGCMVLRLKGHHLALATLCLGVIIAEFINRSKITHGAEGLLELPEITFFGLAKGNGTARFLFIWLVVWVVMVWAVNLAASPVGRALKAVRGDEEAAAALGIPVARVKLKAFVASAVLAAVSGVLYAFVYSPSYLGPEEFSLTLSVMLVTMAVVGGPGSIWGGVIGAVVMTSLHEIISAIGTRLGSSEISRYEQLVYGVLLAAMLIFCPKGLGPAVSGRLMGLVGRAGVRP